VPVVAPDLVGFSVVVLDWVEFPVVIEEEEAAEEGLGATVTIPVMQVALGSNAVEGTGVQVLQASTVNGALTLVSVRLLAEPHRQ
jgi:hypothetical protein